MSYTLYMITVLAGENSFENERILERIIAEFSGEPERIDGEALEMARLPDLLIGLSLFSSQRLVIIKNMSANKPLWSALENWMSRASEDIHLVLVDAKPDKRTKTYKLLQKMAAIHESKLWTDRDTLQAEQWVVQEAKKLGKTLDKKSAHTLVAWVGVDQWALYQALQKLTVLDQVNPEVIKKIIEPHPNENAFLLFETALKGDGQKVAALLRGLEKTDDPYRLFGLLSGQAFQLAALSVAGVPDATVASDLGVHPFVISKLRPLAKRVEKTGAKKIIEIFAEADTALKTSVGDPWLLIERALVKAAKTAR